MKVARTLTACAALLGITVPSAADERVMHQAEKTEWDLAYASFRPGTSDIYLFERIGSPPQRLTDHSGLDYDPAISGEGRWVVFTSERLGSADLFVIDLHGDRTPRPLITGDSHEDQVAFSADGKWIVFVSSHHGQADIYVAPFEPKEPTHVASAHRITTSPHGDFRPAFSPNSRWIAFSSDRDHEPSNANPIGRTRATEIYVVSREGGAPKRLTRDGLWSGSPSWAADGSGLYYYAAVIPSRPNSRPKATLNLVDAEGTRASVVAEGAPLALSPVIDGRGQLHFLRGTPPSPAAAAEMRLLSMGPDGVVTDVLAAPTAFRDFDFAADGRAVAHGPGPNTTANRGGVPTLLGPGPLLGPDLPTNRRLGEATVRLHPIREFFVSGDQGRAGAVLRSPFPPTQLISSTLAGDDAQVIAKPVVSPVPISPASASPDGAWIVYTNGRTFGPPDSEADLIRTSRDGTEVRNLTSEPRGNDGLPTVSSDGRFIYFRSGRDGNYEIYRMHPDGSGVLNITEHPARDTFPALSPDGRLLAFVSDRDQKQDRLFDLYVATVAADGALSSVRRLTNNQVQEGHPVFSPDGEWVVFASEMGGAMDEALLSASSIFSPQPYGELYAYHLARGTIIRLTNDKWEDGMPTFLRADHARP